YAQISVQFEPISDVSKRIATIASAPFACASSTIRSITCCRLSMSAFVIPFSSPPRIDLNPAPSCEPMLRERTVRPMTSPSTSTISCPARSFVVETSILSSFRSSGSLQVAPGGHRLRVILAEEDAAPREDVLVERQRLLVLAAQVKRGREPSHRPERRRVVLAVQLAPRLEHLPVQIPRAPEVAARGEDPPEAAHGRERLRRLVPERATARLEDVRLQ